jgi:hypothetical protein
MKQTLMILLVIFIFDLTVPITVLTFIPDDASRPEAIEWQIVDGVKQDAEVEVEQPLKRLFWFAGEESPRDCQRLLRPL